MKILALLIKTQFFKDSIKTNPEDLASYIIDYADYSSLVLEQLGQYRYRRLRSYILGQENPNKLTQILSILGNSQTFYCNDRILCIPTYEKARAFERPYDYAIVLYNCYQ